MTLRNPALRTSNPPPLPLTRAARRTPSSRLARTQRPTTKARRRYANTDNLVNKVGEIGQDNLIARLFPRALTFGIKIAAGEGELKRGTILTRGADDTYNVYGKSATTGEGDDAVTAVVGEPSAILVEDVDASGDAAVAAVGYCSGNFNLTAVIVAEGYELTAADRDTLRKYDIYFTQMFED